MLSGGSLAQKKNDILVRAQKKLNKDIFEKDNLLKERREKRKKRALYNKKNSKANKL